MWKQLRVHLCARLGVRGCLALAWWVIALDGTGGSVPLPGGIARRTGGALGLMYRGFTFTPMGSVIGLLWALPDGLALGALVAWIYNRLSGAASGAAA